MVLVKPNYFFLAALGIGIFSVSCSNYKHATSAKPDNDAIVTQAITPKCVNSPTGKGGPMCEVPEGPFWRGCNKKIDTECLDTEFPCRNISLSDFFIDRHEVTVGEYQNCVTANVCSDEFLNSPLWDNGPRLDRAESCNWGKSDRKNHPINCVSWYDAQTYCHWVGKRLPTEAEWEKAARGTDGRKFPWGNKEFSDVTMVANIPDVTAAKYYSDDIKELARSSPLEYYSSCYNDGYQFTSPVESFASGVSPYGLFDMAGNVIEYTVDWYSDQWYAESPIIDPVNSQKGQSRFKVARGGSWDVLTTLLRCSDRGQSAPETRDGAQGFRCAYSTDVGTEKSERK